MQPSIAPHLVASVLLLTPSLHGQDGPDLPKPQRFEAARQEVVDGGPLEIVPCPADGRGVPRPEERERRLASNGDEVVREASGDPFFLSFVGGKLHPPADERIDPTLRSATLRLSADARPDAVTYAFVMFAERMTPERVARLEALGCRSLGFHPHYALKVALPAASLEAVAALDFVRWIGVPKPTQKVHTRLFAEAARTRRATLDVYVNVFESDLCDESTYESVGTVQVGGPGGRLEAQPMAREPRGARCRSNGWQQRALEARGVEVLEYVDVVRAFRARLPRAALESVVRLDFVLFVEPDLPEETTHDESMPMALADYTRAFYDGGTNAAALAGVIDSGIDVAHVMLDHFFFVGFEMTPEGSSLIDNNGHGTHVAGTFLGLPLTAAGWTGTAPDLGFANNARFRFVKFIDAAGASFGTVAARFAHMESDFVDAGGNVSPKPHVVNNSWGTKATLGNPFFGSEADPRTVDAEVWEHEQLYVFAAGNEGVLVGNQSLREEATAKNALTVGAVIDFLDETDGAPGNLAAFSSIGPCGDGRWKPNVCAPGSKIRSANANSGNGYANRSGTSMAAPHVSGIAAQLCDHYPTLRYSPHRLASILMATAMTNDDQVLTTPSISSTDHLNTFGTGRVNAARAHYNWGDDTSRTTWAATLPANTGTFADFTVDAGCTRLVVCMTYHEDQCSAGAVPALVNDLDLYIDRPGNGIDPALNAGDFVLQQSNVNNTEIRILTNPESGTWRWKVFPESTTESTRVSVSVVTIGVDTTPLGTLTLTANDSFVQPGNQVQLTASAYNPEYFASNVFLDSTSTDDQLLASTTTLDDGAVTNLLTNDSSGRDVTLGTIRPGDTRSVTWTTRWNTEGIKFWEVSSSSDNWDDGILEIQKAIYVDGTRPTTATDLHSTTHTEGTWSNDPTITYAWTAAFDGISGLDGYGISTEPTVSIPSTVKDIEAVTTYAETLTSGTWHFSLRSVDNSGNWAIAFTSAGPFQIDTLAPLGPSDLHSTTHTPGVPALRQSLTVAWSAATDSLSGLEGYLVAVNALSSHNPIGTPSLAPDATSYTTLVDPSESALYLHVRAKDVAGNYGATQSIGPFLIVPNARRVTRQ
jgi:subtilisin family serine protease